MTMLPGLPPPYEPAQEVLDTLIPYQFSNRLTIFHCRVCGAQMLFRCWKDANDHSQGCLWDVACGTLEKGDGVFRVECHEHVMDTLDGGISDFFDSC